MSPNSLIATVVLCLSTVVTAFSQEPVNPLAVKYLQDTSHIRRVTDDSLSRAKAAQVRISPDSLDAVVEYGSVDSNYLDNKERRAYLFGDAYVRYKDLELTADYIIIDLDSSIATAQGLPDSSGQMAGLPVFKMEGQDPITAGKMRYNFKKRKGMIYEALTTQTDLFIHARRTKFVADGDTIHKEDILYGEGALITTCDAPHPHFGIRALKVKTIPDKLAVIGPSNLEIFGVSTPVWLPFGFYPVSDTRRAGLIIPRDYERSPAQGFGIRDIGYYIPFGEKLDLKLLADIYFNGSYGVGVASNYVKKYKFRGFVELRFSDLVTEPSNSYQKLHQKSFSIRLTHNQDPKANPNQTIGGSIDIRTNNFDSRNYNDAQSVYQNSYSSNFNYSRIFPGKPYSLTAAFTHSQNTLTRDVTLNFPELNFRLNRIYPFKRQNPLGKERFYEKIAFQYNGSARSRIMAKDTALFSPETWRNFEYGAQHRASANLSFNLLSYFNFTPSVNYDETWFFKTRDQVFRFDPTDPMFIRPDTIWLPDSSAFFIENDTVSYGQVVPQLDNGFQAFRSVSASVNMNTQVFSTLLFEKGWLRGIRYVMKPNVGFSYTPQSPDAYYLREQVDIRYPDSTRQFSRFDNLMYSVRPVDVKQANINWSVTNIFEAKYYSAKDSTEKKLKLFENISMSGSYNMARKKNQNPWSPINISGNTRLFKGMTTVSVGATYSPYALRDNGSLDTLTYQSVTGHLLRFDNLRLRFSTNLTYNEVKAIFTRKKKDTSDDTAKSTENATDTRKAESFFDLLSNFSINHELGVVRMGMTGKDTTFLTTHSINMRGSMRLTPNWHLIVGNVGYDFRSERLTYPDIGIARDLHCWQLSFNFQPERGTYQFNISVKPGTFEFLKFPYRRNNFEMQSPF